MSNTAVVILNYNGKKLLQQFLPSVIAHTKQARIIVADNGSTDGSIELIKDQFPSVEIFALDANYGFCGGYNKALKQINSEYYVLLNSDVEVTANWLEPMVQLLDKNASIAAVQPKILSHHQKDQFEYAGAGGGFIDSWGYPFCRGRMFDFTEKDTGQYNDTREVFWASGACLVIRSEVYHHLGGLDETFFAHMEEIDLCWKIHRMDKQVYYCGASTVFHVGAGTLSRNNPRKTYYNFRNGLSLIYKHLPANHLWIKFPLRIGLDVLAAIKFMLEGQQDDAKAVFRAIRDFMKTRNLTQHERSALKKKFPYSMSQVYNGMLIIDYYLLKRRVIPIEKLALNNPK